MAQCKITVLKTMLNQDLAKEYCQGEVGPCYVFHEGQEFVVGLEKPKEFCDWAWHDLLPYITAFLAGGNFSGEIFDGWMKDDRTMIACCTDGIRPVVFKIEKLV
ncbi:MAG: TIGR04076 family protein [Dehalobacterium sp.]